MAPSRSSTVAIAQGLPFLVILRWSELIIPAIVTVAPSGRPSSAVSAAIGVSDARARMCSTPKSGWSLT